MFYFYVTLPCHEYVKAIQKVFSLCLYVYILQENFNEAPQENLIIFYASDIPPKICQLFMNLNF